VTISLPASTTILPKRSRELGFTLLELLLVMTILSTVAWMSLAMVGNQADQVRFEDTRNRLQTIRRAIIGDTSRTLNGQPEIRGFVADMGNLPANLQALLVKDYCPNRPSVSPAACGAAWVTQPAYSYDAVHGLWSGWNGPYLSATELADYPRFQDGWGNRNDAANNFGWNYLPDALAAGDLTIQSLGRDGVAVATTDTYDADFPPAGQPIIRGSEYRVLITDSGTAAQGDGSGGLRVDFGSPPATQPALDLCMALAFRRNGSVETVKSSRVALAWDGTPRIVEFVFEDAVGPQFDADTFLSLGQAAYGVFVWNTAAGSCDMETPFPAGSAPWTTFTNVPGTLIPPFARTVN
jgi:prepilin-type N-terminal cleavage/methylation domain-containing protein